MIKVKFYKALSNPAEAILYAENHEKMLSVFGYKKVTSADISWTKNPLAYFLLMEVNNEPIGGIRVQTGSNSIKLPIQKAIGDVDVKTNELLQEEVHNGISEICGLWKLRVPTSGIGVTVLLKSAVAVAGLLSFQKMIGLASFATKDMLMNMGFAVAENYGDLGKFDYPTPDMQAVVLKISDLTNLPYASEMMREDIFNLRKNPKQIRQEQTKNGIVEIEYDLTLD